jgi:AcrR family transcriptional regulator
MTANDGNWLMISTQVAFRRTEAPPSVGLRSRKKARTRLAIEDAALQLFEERGYEATTVEQIAECAEISATTLFRYFPSKAEIVLSDHGDHLPALFDAIVARPPSEHDVVAVQVAVQRAWASGIDPERTARKEKVVAGSDVLRGMSYQRGFRWLEVVTDALAERKGLTEPDESCSAAARLALSVLGSAVESWIADECRGDLSRAVDHWFDVMAGLCGAWSGGRAPGGPCPA